MNDETAELGDENLASWLAACDDALAAGRPASSTQYAVPTAEDQERLERDLDCVRLLRTYWSGTGSWPAANSNSSAVDGIRDVGSLTSPDAIGRFQIRRQLGEGGYGIVFLAFDPQLGREVALKIPRSDVLVSSDLRGRFQHEARTAASLDHSNIVQVFEAGEIGPVCYIASAYCPGPTLAEWIKQPDPIPFKAATQIIAALADAVQHAHSRGVLHRDLKPANVLLTDQATSIHPSGNGDGGQGAEQWTPKITDFGLAKLLEDGDSAQTRTGPIVGTPNYMAPEQAAGRTKEISTASDIYALGTILYELLTGRPPFRADTPLEVLRKIASEEPVPPSRPRPHTPRDLETICLKCLQKEPQRRYQTAAALGDDLRRFLSGMPVLARPVSTFERLGRWCRRQPLVASLAGIVLLLIVGIAIVAPVAAVTFRNQRDTAIKLKGEADRAKSAESIAKQNALDKLWDSQLAQAQARRWSNRPGRRFDSLETIREAARARPAIALRNEAAACLALLDVRPIPGWQPRHVLAFDADFERYARRDSDGIIIVHRTQGDAELQRLPGIGVTASEHMGVQFSPDGKYLAACYARSTHFIVWELTTRRKVIESNSKGDGEGFDFSSDGRLAAIGETAHAIRVIDLSSGGEVARLSTRDAARGLIFHPRERRIAVAHHKSDAVDILDIDSGKVLQTVNPPSRPISIAWHPEGDRLAITANESNRILIWNVRGGTPSAELIGHQSQAVTCRFSHGGDFLVSTSLDGTTRIWDTATGAQLLSITGKFVQLRRDDRQLSYLTGDYSATSMCELAAGRECRILSATEGQGGGPWSVSMDHSGRLLASAADDCVRIWDVAASRQVAVLPTGRSEVSLFHPTKPYLLTHGIHGIHRWPVRHESLTGSLQIGPPEALRGPGRSHHSTLSLSRDGRWVGAVVGPQDAEIIDLENTAKVVSLKGTPGIWQVIVSSDGHWAATCPQHGNIIQIWDARTGKMLRELPSGVYATATFSPNNLWMVTTSQGYPPQTWKTESWEEIPHQKQHGGGMFDSTGKLLAVKRGTGRFDLVDATSGAELVSLTPPNPFLDGGTAFSPDGGLLAVAGYASQSIQLWDLRAFRRQLAELNLDWERSNRSAPIASQPLKVDVLPGKLGAAK